MDPDLHPAAAPEAEPDPAPAAEPRDDADTQPARLSEALREGSAAEHRAAEGSPFVGDLMAGRATPAQYAGYLRRLRVVYGALETAVRAHRDHPAVAAVYDEGLVRTDALDRDLRHWSSGVEPEPPSAGASAYRERIEVASGSPELLVAHHYTRYLGDLSGGRMLAHALRASRDGDDTGLDFYDFPAVPKPVPYKRDYRDRLDALSLTGGQRSALVEEARRAFRLNRTLLDEAGALA